MNPIYPYSYPKVSKRSKQQTKLAENQCAPNYTGISRQHVSDNSGNIANLQLSVRYG